MPVIEGIGVHDITSMVEVIMACYGGNLRVGMIHLQNHEDVRIGHSSLTQDHMIFQSIIIRTDTYLHLIFELTALMQSTY